MIHSNKLSALPSRDMILKFQWISHTFPFRIPASVPMFRVCVMYSLTDRSMTQRVFARVATVLIIVRLDPVEP